MDLGGNSHWVPLANAVKGLEISLVTIIVNVHFFIRRVTLKMQCTAQNCLTKLLRHILTRSSATHRTSQSQRPFVHILMHWIHLRNPYMKAFLLLCPVDTRVRKYSITYMHFVKIFISQLNTCHCGKQNMFNFCYKYKVFQKAIKN